MDLMRAIAFSVLTIVATVATSLPVLASGVSIQAELDAATEISKVQPSAELIERIELQPSLDDPDVRRAIDLDPKDYPYRPSTALVRHGLPFFEYYALREGSRHVVHPMALGRFLLRNASGGSADKVLSGALGVAHHLPNGGLAWYYPRHYRVARMLGKNLKYSSISQGTIIAGLTAMAHAGTADPAIASKAFEAMLWPFELGGVNLANLAVLEMPSFAGPPEIILNGWIDALLHIRDHGEISRNQNALDFFKSNVSFLSKILPNFDAREARISRYSDVSPYRAKVRLAAPEDFAGLQLLYRPKIDGLPAIRVPLESPSDAAEVSIYDNRIIRQNGRDAQVWLSCSQLYETVLVSQSSEMTVAIGAGKIDRKATTPGSQGNQLSFESRQDGNYRVVEIAADDGLICGYPTNFSKPGGRNSYHAYHIVGLMLVAMSPGLDEPVRKTLIQWALKWKTDYEYLEKNEGLSFIPLQEMLLDIGSNQALVKYTDFDILLRDVLAVLESDQ